MYFLILVLFLQIVSPHHCYHHHHHHHNCNISLKLFKLTHDINYSAIKTPLKHYYFHHYSKRTKRNTFQFNSQTSLLFYFLFVFIVPHFNDITLKIEYEQNNYMYKKYTNKHSLIRPHCSERTMRCNYKKTISNEFELLN